MNFHEQMNATVKLLFDEALYEGYPENQLEADLKKLGVEKPMTKRIWNEIKRLDKTYRYYDKKRKCYCYMPSQSARLYTFSGGTDTEDIYGQMLRNESTHLRDIVEKRSLELDSLRDQYLEKGARRAKDFRGEVVAWLSLVIALIALIVSMNKK